ncbi:hypothetical protein RB595_010700 [Gaeumannomyces hyphopodioides]
MQFRALLIVAFAGIALAAPAPAEDCNVPNAAMLKRVKAQEKHGMSCSPSSQCTFYCTDFQGGDCFINRAGSGTCLF